MKSPLSAAWGSLLEQCPGRARVRIIEQRLREEGVTLRHHAEIIRVTGEMVGQWRPFAE
jgi:hypothetical protein